MTTRRAFYERMPNGFGKFAGYIEDPKVDAFIAEILAVCEKHGMDIAHEDDHGAFQIVPAGYGSFGEHASQHVPPSPEAKRFSSLRGGS